MTPTPEQELALNRAIWNVDETNCTPDGNGGYIVHTEKNYTRDLNAIVDVVQRWQVGHRRAISMANIENGLPCFVMLTDDNTGEDYRASALTYALALCIAFAQAAGLEWEKE